MKRNISLYSICLFAAGSSAISLSAKEKTNVVFILADDLGYSDLSCYGQEKFQTPNIDELAQRGIRFTQCYSGTTVSAPSRCSLVTGMHTGNTCIRGNSSVNPDYEVALPTGTNTIFKIFKEAGYKTGAFGKWGLGEVGSTGDPNKQFVDTFFGYNSQLLAHNYYPDHMWDNDKRIDYPENANGAYGTYSQDEIHKHALKFIDDNKEEPFFLFIPYVLPHAELLVPEDSIIQKFRGMYPEQPHHGTDSGPMFRKGGYCSQVYPHATFAAMVYRYDVYVGQIVAKLKELGLYDNTLIIFTSDNGPHREGGADPEFFNSNGIYRGIKRDLYEGGIRVPMIAAWPGQIEEGTISHQPCAFWDMMPTFAEVIHTKKAPECDGISILPTLKGEKGQKQHDYFYFEFHEMNGRQAIIRGNWKLILLDIQKSPKYELYNIAADPSEVHNMIDRNPEKFAELKTLMEQVHTKDTNWPLLPAEF